MPPMLRGHGRILLGLTCAAALACSLPAGASAWSPGSERYAVGKRVNQAVTMADGTVLRADVYYPADKATGNPAKGKFPVLLTQTPYGKDAAFLSDLQASGGQKVSGLGSNHPYMIKRGYIEVFADVRGTGSSQGQWGLFDPVQGRDGATLARWAARLPHSNGKVGLIGASYLGITQFMTVKNLPKHSPVKAIFPIIAGGEVYRDIVTQGGMIDTSFGATYLGLTGSLNITQPFLETLNNLSNGEGPNSDLVQVEGQHFQGLLDYHLATLANVETDGDLGYDGKYWHDRSPAFGMLDAVVRRKIPAFLVGGWFDVFQRGEPNNYAALQNLWAGRRSYLPMRPGQNATGRYQLLQGPWYHLTAGSNIDLDRLEIAWFDRWLKGRTTGIERTRTPLHSYDLAAKRYFDTARYPYPEAKPRTYFLGAGTLSRSAPSASGGSDSVLFTGLSVPCGRAFEQWTMGAAEFLLNLAGGTDPCAADDRLGQNGPGVATYTTSPFSKPAVLAGPIAATLFATSTVKDAEFIAKIEDVAPDGSSKPLTSGALLGSHRALDTRRSWFAKGGRPLAPYHPYTRSAKRPLTPGHLTRFDIEIFPTFSRLAPGHRLRLTLDTSDIPHIVPTPSQFADLAGGRYEIGHNAAAPSYLEVPLAPASAFQKRCSICR
jgi:putative CocE/NonD family hydrolase